MFHSSTKVELTTSSPFFANAMLVAGVFRIVKLLKLKNMSKSKVEHTTIRNEKLFCLNCGGQHPLIMPIPIKEMTNKIDAFNVLHKDCKPTWKEPVADQSKSIQEKAMFWLANGHVGMSSRTMFNCLIGNKDFAINHPYDPDDFSRCWKLLEAVPEWKNELHKLKPLSKQWSNLVDNWDKLTEFYENMRQVKKANGMYEFMQTLIS